MEEVRFIRARKKDSVYEMHPSSITDHVTRNNHTIDWEGVKFPVEIVIPQREVYGRPLPLRRQGSTS